MSISDDQVEAMVRDAHSAFARLGTLGLGARMSVGDLCCYVMALAEEVERLRREGPFRPKTLVHHPGGVWDAFDDDWQAARHEFPGNSGEPTSWNVSTWHVHRKDQP